MISRINHFLKNNNLRNLIQHGFRESRDCLWHPLNRFDDVLKALGEGYNNIVIHRDFNKPFDRVDHKIMLKKFLILESTESCLANKMFPDKRKPACCV